MPTYILDQLNQCLWRWDAGAHGFWSSPVTPLCCWKMRTTGLVTNILTQLERPAPAAVPGFSGLGSPQGSAEQCRALGLIRDLDKGKTWGSPCQPSGEHPAPQQSTLQKPNIIMGCIIFYSNENNLIETIKRNDECFNVRWPILINKKGSETWQLLNYLILIRIF